MEKISKNDKKFDYKISKKYVELGKKVQLILRIGQLLMENSADTNRIIRTMKRVGNYFSITEENLTIHITYTTIMVSANVGNYYISKMQKCTKHHVDMSIITGISKLSWSAYAKNYSLVDFEKELDKIENTKSKYNALIINLGAAIACGGFGKMLGCDFVASIYTAIAAYIGFYTRHKCINFGVNPYMSIAISAFVASFIAYFTHFLPFTNTPWYPMLGCTLFIVPGIPLINAVEDFLDSCITSGMTRGIHTLLMVTAMTFGIVFTIKIFDVVDFTDIPVVNDQSYFVYIVAAFISAVGFSTMFNLPRKLLPIVGIGGIICVLTRTLTMEFFDVTQPVGTFLGAMLVSFIALKAIHWFHVPTHVLVIPSVIPLIPGLYMYRLLFSFININSLPMNKFVEALQGGITSILIILAIAVGVALPNIFAQKYITKLENQKLQSLTK